MFSLEKKKIRTTTGRRENQTVNQQIIKYTKRVRNDRMQPSRKRRAVSTVDGSRLMAASGWCAPSTVWSRAVRATAARSDEKQTALGELEPKLYLCLSCFHLPWDTVKPRRMSFVSFYLVLPLPFSFFFCSLVLVLVFLLHHFRFFLCIIFSPFFLFSFYFPLIFEKVFP